MEWLLTVEFDLCIMCQQQPPRRPVLCVSIPLLLPSMSGKELLNVLCIGVSGVMILGLVVCC